MNEELEIKRKQLRLQLHEMCMKKRLSKEETKKYCEMIGEEYPEDLEYDYGNVHDWGKDFSTEMRLCFCVNEKPEKTVCSIWSSNEENNIYAIYYIRFKEIEQTYPLKIYPYTEEELEFIKLKKEKKIEAKNKAKFNLNKKAETTKFKFGKYKGQAVLDILKTDMKYIEWCLSNIKEFKEYLEKIKN